jgi:hypothetical protein
VSGAAKKVTATVGSTGAYSAKVRLAEGANHLTVSGRDPLGYVASAKKTIRFADPVSLSKLKKKKSALSVQVHCAKFATVHGCHGTVSLRVGKHAYRHLSYKLKRGHAHKVMLKLAHSLKARLHRAGHLTVTVSASYQDPTGGHLSTSRKHKIT